MTRDRTASEEPDGPSGARPTDETAGGKRGRGRPRDVAVDDAILRAALELFIERGVEGTSIEQVARSAGVGKLTVYRRWSTKEELIAQALEVEFRPGEWTADPSWDEAELTGFLERAAGALSEYMATPRYQALIARVLGLSRSHPRLMRVYWDRFAAPRRTATRALLERAVANGRLPRDTDVDVVMDMIVGSVIYRLLQPDQPTAEELRRYQLAVFRQAGLLP